MQNTIQDFKLRFRHIWPAMIAILGCIYFGYHTFSGDRGIMRLREVTKKVEESKKIAQEIAAQKEALEKEIMPLRKDSLDLDKLEEEALKLLNFASPDDFVIVDADANLKGDDSE